MVCRQIKEHVSDSAFTTDKYTSLWIIVGPFYGPPLNLPEPARTGLRNLSGDFRVEVRKLFGFSEAFHFRTCQARQNDRSVVLTAKITNQSVNVSFYYATRFLYIKHCDGLPSQRNHGLETSGIFRSAVGQSVLSREHT